MTHVTGIELGPSSCVLVSARPHEAGLEIAGAQTFIRTPDSASLTASLRSARRAGRLPRRARVVSWALSAPSSVDDPIRQPILQPFVDAGFRIEALLTPAEALARLAATRSRPGEDPVAWLSLNMHGAVIAIVDAADILFSRTLSWKYNVAPRTTREQLLQRYVLVMHIAPELQRGISIVRTNHGKTVQTIVTCGNLPDLRSLTMPLIDELDLEVETLDSTDGLRPARAVAPEALAEIAPAVRLAGAAAVAPMQSTQPSTVLPAVAAAVLLVLGGWLAASALRLTSSRIPIPPPPVQRDAAAPGSPASQKPLVPQTPPASPVVSPRSAADTPTPAASTGSASSGTVGVVGSAAENTQSPEIARPSRLPSVPPVTSILVDGGRRWALIGGEIVGVGDSVGPRVVVRIDQRSVVLREPSGREITVLLSAGKSDGLELKPFTESGRSPSTRTHAAR